MKRVVVVKLVLDEDEFAAVLETVELCNSTANIVSEYAYNTGKRDRGLRTDIYQQVKSEGLSAQPAQHVIKKVSDAYKTLKANLKAGTYGEPGSKSYLKAASKPIKFRKYSAQPYDDRCLSWQMDAQTVSIWTVHGRLKNIPFVGHSDQLADLRKFRKGESDLVFRDGVFYLIATLGEETPQIIEPTNILGVDLGIVNIATTSTGKIYSGKKTNRTRERYQRIRTVLQKKNTKSAKRRLKARRRKEARFVKDVNHCVSKKVVAEAQRTGNSISLEDLTGIRERVRLRKPQRAAVNSWAFRQLGDFIAYKAERKGVLTVFVDSAYTSQTCSECWHCEKKNRKNQETFKCRNCGVSLHADVNAARNIAVLGALSTVPSLMRPHRDGQSRRGERKPSPSGLGS